MVLSSLDSILKLWYKLPINPKSAQGHDEVTDIVIADNKLPLNTSNRTGPKNIPLQDILYLYCEKKLNFTQIAKIIKCSRQNIIARLKRENIDIVSLDNFRKYPDKHYEVLQHRLLNSIKNKDIEKINAYMRIGSIALLEDKKRLIRGQSTQSIDFSHVSKEIDELEKKREELQNKLREYQNREDLTIDITPTPQDVDNKPNTSDNSNNNDVNNRD